MAILKIRDENGKFIEIPSIKGEKGDKGDTGYRLTNTASGESVIIDDALEDKVSSLEIDGKSVQDGTPTPDTPVEIESVGTENLFDNENWYETLNAVNSTSMIKEMVNGVEYYKVRPDAIYNYQYMKGQFKENTRYTIIAKARQYDIVDQTSTGLVIYYTDGTKNYQYVNRTLEEYDYKLISEENKTIDCIGLGYAYNNYILMRDIMMIEGTEEKSYVPYGKFGIEVKRIGKNLQNSNLRNGIYNATTGLFDNNSSYLSNVDFIPVKPDTNYVFSSDLNYSFEAYLFDKDKNYIGRAFAESNKFTTTSDTYYINWRTLISGQNNINCIVQIEEGTISTEYQPYQSNTSVIALNEPLRSLPNEVKDTYENGVVTRRVGKVVLNGSEDYSVFTYGTSHQNTTMFSSRVLAALIKKTDGTKANDMYSDKFKLLSNTVATLNTDDNWFMHDTESKVYFCVENSIASTVDGFKTWLSNNNVEVIYELATPTTETVEMPVINTFEGTNNIDVNGGISTTFNVTYTQDIRKIVDEYTTEEEVQNLINEALGIINTELASLTEVSE